jgi:hypothetical protein
MVKISEKQFLEWNSRGIVPGPGESEIEYIVRAEYCLNLKSQIVKDLEKEAPFTKSPPASQSYLKEALRKTKELFDIAPDWTPLFFSDYELTPWHGGSAWIFQSGKDSPRGALLQLRRAFYASTTYLKIYHRDEFIAHELAHVGRMKFEEPDFEEFFAYRTSKSPFRRWFGPIVKSFWESLAFIGALLIIVFLDFARLFMNEPLLYTASLWLKLALTGVVAFGIGRLWWRHRQFSLCFKRLKELLADNSKTHAVIYRLTDYEIRSLSSMDAAEIPRFVKKGHILEMAGYFRGLFQ